MRRVLFTLSVAVASLMGQDLPSTLPEVRYHLTARPWKPLAIPREAYLNVIEGICRFSIRHQNEQGAIIDPFLKREHQYSTPYFALAAGVLLDAGRASDLKPAAIRAMEHATRSFSGGSEAIPDEHGEFFIPALTGALDLFRKHVSETVWNQWRERLRVPVARIARGGVNNWRTYAMKGEWMRALAGLADRDQARAYVAAQWRESQRNRILPDKWNLYWDHSSDPESHAVEAVGRGNLLALVQAGYDGPYAGEIRHAVERGSLSSLLLQDPTGQCPMNGRTDDHVFNDALYQLAFEVMAERSREQGNQRLASQYRRAAMLGFQSIGRWLRGDGEWAGSFYITKNRFPPEDRTGYQPASNYGNYNGAVMMHLGEAWLARRSNIAEAPAPAEIGGYAITMSDAFGSAFANAGGTMMAANLRGDTLGRYDTFWTPLGVVRFSRPGWDSRLGPSDGGRDWTSRRGVSFAPEWSEQDRWVRLSELPELYRGKFDVQFAHPLLVRCRIEYRPLDFSRRPWFQHEFVITPDGVLTTLKRMNGSQPFALTVPLLENDGAPLETKVSQPVLSTRYPGAPDRQNFLLLGDAVGVDATEPAIRSSYGWLRPVRVEASDVFVYPETAGDPEPALVRGSFRRMENGFVSILGRVEDDLYIGRTAAGGAGRSLDLNGDGKPELEFDASCGFIAQIEAGRITAIETDRAVTGRIAGRPMRFRAHRPLRL